MGSMKARRQKKSRESRLLSASAPKLPFIEHLHELRKRLFYVALSVGLWGTAAYFVQQKIVATLLKPAHNQQFIYTSVGGGIDFLFRVCIYAGIVCSIPVIVYHILKYIEPLVRKKDAIHFIAWGSVVSGLLAILGILFGYFVGLPSALHFLLHQFTTDQIHPLLTIQSYMSFVTLYMLGSALLFQLPLLLVLINRIRPLKPKKLLGYERWVILLAFVGGGIMNPSPRIQDQVLLAGPIILAYQVGVFLVWRINRRSKRPKKVLLLREKDQALQNERQQQFAKAQELLLQKKPVATVAQAPMTPYPVTVAPMQPKTAPIASQQAVVPLPPRPHTPIRGRSYVNDFTPRPVRSFGQGRPTLDSGGSA